jgi:predicted transcriptional regulator
MTSQPSSSTADQSAATDYSADVRAAIASGMAESLAGRTVPVEQIRAMFGLDP